MTLQRGAIPLYYQIAQILRSQIHSQEYKPKDLLPTEEDLVRTFGVSRTTVRQALQMLLREELIYRIPGKGTFVAEDRQTRKPDWSVESIDGLVKAGYVTKVRFSGLKTIPAGEGLAQSFRIRPGTLVTEFRKLEFVGDEPFIHITIYVPCDLAAKIPVDRIEEKPVFALMEERCRIRIREAHQWVSASLVGSDIARHLKLKAGDPVLLVERHFIDDTERVVQISLDRYRTDRMRHFLRLTRADALGVVPGRRSAAGAAGSGARQSGVR